VEAQSRTAARACGKPLAAGIMDIQIGVVRIAFASTCPPAIHTGRLPHIEGLNMARDDFPAPDEGFVVTNFLVVSDQDRSREFYRSIFDGKVVREKDPVIMRVANTWLILNVGGGPTDDKPTVTLSTPNNPDHASAFMNVRVAVIAWAYKEWSARGAQFLTDPKDHGFEIRAYIRDPDGHLIEVGQSRM